ncbi:hypothetical protein [Chondromyces crocatus]|uniref:Adenylate kinase n=1 Tax=Chondromyces crocatus TaxID=52 RepID=A0A0K1E7S6_CHOCO|nr:hypothetical protein [Chondromyces crocatus]AKT36914.1 uncharacterized protein CMC5_010350 [Chondromyces crocatus]
MIVGNPASGKSTLSKAWGHLTGLPVFHMDLYMWKPGWEMVGEAEFAEVHAGLLQKPRWIIEGYSHHAPFVERLGVAEQIVFVDAPLAVCLERARQRREREAASPDGFIPEDCRFETIWEQHLAFIEQFDAEVKPSLVEMLRGELAATPQVWLDGRDTVEAWCGRLEVARQEATLQRARGSGCSRPRAG